MFEEIVAAYVGRPATENESRIADTRRMTQYTTTTVVRWIGGAPTTTGYYDDKRRNRTKRFVQRETIAAR